MPAGLQTPSRSWIASAFERCALSSGGGVADPRSASRVPGSHSHGGRVRAASPFVGTPVGTLSADAKSFHVTTFGCQMNVHDSERMRGMLASLGYEEAREPRRGRPDPLQHLLDPRVGRQPLHRPPRRGEAAEERRPEPDRRRRRLLGAVGQGRGLRALPLRRRRLRPRPDPQAGRVPQLRLAQRPGLLRVRGLLRPPADPARARVPGLAADLPGLQLRLLLLHRALDPRAARSAATRTS